ncbi:transmembrane emp24 domain-containing protein 1-like [Thalassophryne amazonica]|uniref:transmembrane emp24 domain-containing protein 1-like n=1 Tax=Thalassophryne amazonica TaxID=390379 RepID=UPI0014709F00|nr:transmembrane emp24 domain-containing protein 1-like [Thalassophryne amazonica]
MNWEWTLINVTAMLCLLVCFILTDLTLGSDQNLEFTFILPAGTTECFYQTTAENSSMEVEYQVIAGAGLNVGFILISPSGHQLASDFRRSDGIHMVNHTEDGDYRLCFDNSYSTLSEKIVFFKVIINRPSCEGGGRSEWLGATMTEDMVDYKLEEIRTKMDSVHQHLERSRQVQTSLRAFEARDRYLLEDNLWRVSFWSCFNLFVLLTVSVTQIYTLKRLFDGSTTVRT